MCVGRLKRLHSDVALPAERSCLLLLAQFNLLARFLLAGSPGQQEASACQPDAIAGVRCLAPHFQSHRTCLLTAWGVQTATSPAAPDADEVFEALAHAQAVNGQVPCVQEVVDPLVGAAAAGVRL